MCLAGDMRLRIQDGVVGLDGLSGRIEHDQAGRCGRADLAGYVLEYCVLGLEDGQGYKIEMRQNQHATSTLTYHRTEGEPFLELGGNRSAITVRENTVFNGGTVIGHVTIDGHLVEVELTSSGTDNLSLGLAVALNAVYEWRRGLFRP